MKIYYKTTIFLSLLFIPIGLLAKGKIHVSPEQSAGMSIHQGGKAKHQIREHAGRKAFVVDPAKPERPQISLSYDVLDSAFADGNTPKVLISFSYFDQGRGVLNIEYDSSDQNMGKINQLGAGKYAGGVLIEGSQTWKTFQVEITDALFSNRCNGGDFRLRYKGSDELIIGECSVEAAPHLLKYPLAAAKPALQNPKNFLILVIDDLCARVRSFGFDHIQTPHIDSVSKSGIRFQQAYCQYPVCGPSRASFLSGLYPESSGALSNNIHFRQALPHSVTYLEYFKNNGYWTGGVGKIFHAEDHLIDIGRSTYKHIKHEDAVDFQRTKLTRAYIAEHGQPDGPKENKALNNYIKKNMISNKVVVQVAGSELGAEYHKDGRNARRAVKWIDDKAWGDSPFMLAVGITRPHVPFYTPKKYFEMYPTDTLKFEDVPENDWNDIPAIADTGRHKAFQMKKGVDDREKRAKWIQAYHACVSFADAQVGLVLNALKRNSLDKNTIVVFHSDHGFHMGEHFQYGKVTLWEECTRVPLSIFAPGLTQAGSQNFSNVELVDIFPTLCDLAGLPIPTHLQGQSLMPIIQNPALETDDTALTVVRRRANKKDIIARSVKYQRWRYSEWDSPEVNELYNLDSDPHMHENLAKNPEFSHQVKMMRDKLNIKRF